MTKNAKPDFLWLAQALVTAQQKHISVDDFLHHAKLTLPASYQATLEKMTVVWHTDKSLSSLLRAINHPKVTQLANVLEKNNAEPMSVLSRWSSGLQHLAQIQLSLKSTVTTRLFYIVAVLLVWSTCFSNFLLFVVPNYEDWYTDAIGAAMPPLTDFMVTLATSDAWEIVRTLIYLSGPLAVIYYILTVRKLRRIVKGETFEKASRWFPWLTPYFNLTLLHDMSIGVQHEMDKIKTLTTIEQQAALQLADKFGYLAEEAGKILHSPESYWTQRITRQFHRISTLVTVMLWLMIAFFVFAVYQPIFQLGAVA